MGAGEGKEREGEGGDPQWVPRAQKTTVIRFLTPFRATLSPSLLHQKEKKESGSTYS